MDVAPLFQGHNRPLVAAFFGGPGVGKSTLLNRLAKESVAKTGIERPTSREVTFYLPAAAKLEQLPPGIPVDKVRISHYPSNGSSRIVWVDMPDIDSIERSNRDLALALLPYIDVLIYVVSPERYRDLEAWQLLLEYRQALAWLFVMNHWDQGCEEQIQDFIDQLKAIGFVDPIVLRCDSRPEIYLRKPDDFGKLEEILASFLRAEGLEHLAARNEHAQLEQAAICVTQWLRALGDPDAFERLRQNWQTIWRNTIEAVRPGLAWPIQALATRIGAGDFSSLKDSELTQALLWDSWMDQTMLDSLDKLILEAKELGLEPEPICRCMALCRDEMSKMMIDQVQLHLHRSLASPGHWLQRFGVRCFGLLKYLLPLTAGVWAGYQLVLGYMQQSYLGLDFVVHSGFLIFLAWLIPSLGHRLLEPSLEKAALSGIRKGLALGFDHIAEAIDQRLVSLQSIHRDRIEGGRRLLQTLNRENLTHIPSTSGTEIFDRMLAAAKF
ncbi:MAG: GTPase domain-containing protein [Methylohalobius sp.]|nr:GTPase domain-containing protein [Methylohalobius sp.]